MGRVGCPPNKSESMKFVQIGTEKVCEPRDGKLFCIALRSLSKDRFTLRWRSPTVMNSRGFQNLIGREQHSCPVVVYTTVKSPLVENIVHG